MVGWFFLERVLETDRDVVAAVSGRETWGSFEVALPRAVGVRAGLGTARTVVRVGVGFGLGNSLLLDDGGLALFGLAVGLGLVKSPKSFISSRSTSVKSMSESRSVYIFCDVDFCDAGNFVPGDATFCGFCNFC